jgi:hypothetical protein
LINYSKKVYCIVRDGDAFLYQNGDTPQPHLVFLSRDDAVRFIKLNNIQGDNVDVYEVLPGTLRAACLGTWQSNTAINFAFIADITNMADLN